jgi:tRNA (guanine37-N1)-methyltransferase
MKIDILTLFPEMFDGVLNESILRRAIDKKLVTITTHNLRDWATDVHKTVDDRPYGGGPGMILKVDIVDRALKDIQGKYSSFVKTTEDKQTSKIILLSAKGTRYTQQKAQEFAKIDHLVLICGHYEGIDHRVYEMADEVISVGDFVLTGGEIPAMLLADSVIRLLPGVLGDDASSVDESHSTPGYIEYPQYTRPEDYNGKKVPEVLLSGDHAKIKAWRDENSRKD